MKFMAGLSYGAFAPSIEMQKNGYGSVFARSERSAWEVELNERRKTLLFEAERNLATQYLLAETCPQVEDEAIRKIYSLEREIKRLKAAIWY